MMPVRVVLDTSVLVSALLFHSGSLSWLRGTWQSGHILLLVSRDTTKELIRVLTYPKFALSGGEQRNLLDDYLPFCESVTVSIPPPWFLNVETLLIGRFWSWRLQDEQMSW